MKETNSIGFELGEWSDLLNHDSPGIHGAQHSLMTNSEERTTNELGERPV
jgi:hypothetical protein